MTVTMVISTYLNARAVEQC